MYNNDDYYKPATAPLTKNVDQLFYEVPKFSNPWFTPPEFLKVFSDLTVDRNKSVTFDCMLLGNPRPRVTWLFNNKKLPFDDVVMHDTSEVCQLTIPHVRDEHYGQFTIFAENEVGRAVCTAALKRPSFQ